MLPVAFGQQSDVPLSVCLPVPQSGLTPLHLAAQEDKVNVAEVLVNHGATIDPETKVILQQPRPRPPRRAAGLLRSCERGGATAVAE